MAIQVSLESPAWLDDGHWRLEFRCESVPGPDGEGPLRPERVWLEGPPELPPRDDGSLDPAAPVALLLGMLTGEDVHLAGPVSAILLASINGRVQDILRLWLDCPRITMTADAQVEPVAPSDASTACMFSGGVDSNHVMARFAEDIEHAIAVHGFDLKLDQPRRFEEVLPSLYAGASVFDAPLRVVKTNVRDVLDSRGAWIMHYGAAMAMVAHAVAGPIGRMLWGSSSSFDSPCHYGSHPLLDSLWSTPAMKTQDDGSDRRRAEKVEDLTDRPDVLRNLRVCWIHTGQGLNCGECEKCLRTMVALKLNGVLEQVPFNTKLTPEKIAALRFWDGGGPFMWRQVLRRMRDENILPEYAAAIEQAMFDSTPKPEGWAPRRTLLERVKRRVPRSVSRLLRR